MSSGSLGREKLPLRLSRMGSIAKTFLPMLDQMHGLVHNHGDIPLSTLWKRHTWSRALSYVTWQHDTLRKYLKLDGKCMVQQIFVSVSWSICLQSLNAAKRLQGKVIFRDDLPEGYSVFQKQSRSQIALPSKAVTNRF